MGIPGPIGQKVSIFIFTFELLLILTKQACLTLTVCGCVG